MASAFSPILLRLLLLLLAYTQLALAAFDSELPACNQRGQSSKVFTFYMHDDLEVKPIGSAFVVVPALKTVNSGPNPNAFGAIAVFDDPITEGPDPSSKLLGRARGFYIFNAINDTGATLEIQFTVVFGDGTDFPDSTLSYQGYDKIANAEREISVVGGTGVFRLARGWAVITTQAIDAGAANLNVKSYVYYGCEELADSAAGLSMQMPHAWVVFIMAMSVSFCVLYDIEKCVMKIPTWWLQPGRSLEDN